MTQEPALESVGQEAGAGFGLGGVDIGHVVGVDRGLPGVAHEGLAGFAVELDQGRVDELHLARGIGQPDGGGRGVGHQAESGLALAQRGLRRLGVGNVDRHGDIA